MNFFNHFKSKHFALSFLVVCVLSQGCSTSSGERATHSASTSAVDTSSRASAVTASGSRMHVRFVDVGQGDCTVVRFPYGKVLMIDCGSTKGSNPPKIRKEVLNMLDWEHPTVNTLIVTHPDADHYNLVEATLKGVDVEQVCVVGSSDEYGTKFGAWLEKLSPGVLKIMKANDWNKTVPKILGDFGTAKVYVLAADVEDVSVGSEKNTRSIVSKISYKDFDLIITGDATFDTENSIINRYSNDAEFLDVEMLKLGHHGSRATSTSDEWLNAVKPEWAVASAGYFNDYGHPARDVIKRVEGKTISTSPHELRWSWRINRTSYYEDVHDYTEAIFASGSSGTIDIYSDGTVEPQLETEK